MVCLPYTNLFRRDHHWQRQAQYELEPGELCGFRQSEGGEGEIELVLSYTEGAGDDTRKLFQGAFERFLRRRKVQIGRIPVAICARGHLQERAVVRRAIIDKQAFFFCASCGTRLVTPRVDDIGVPSERHAKTLNEAVATADHRTIFEVAIAWIKAFRRDQGDGDQRPTCFLSYAWGDPQHERWVEQLADHLQHGDVEIIFDRWHNLPGMSISRFIERIEAANYVCPIGTHRYREKDQTSNADPVVLSELRLIKTKVRKRDDIQSTVIPLLLEGSMTTAFPPLLEDSVFVDFRSEENFLINYLS